MIGILTEKSFIMQLVKKHDAFKIMTKKFPNQRVTFFSKKA